MNNEQIAEQIANELWPEEWKQLGDFRIEQNLGRREIATAAALRALEHQEKRIAELEAENERLREEKIFVGYTNGYQLFYAAATEDENSMPCGQGSFYRDTDNDTTIPLYMLATHKHRIETTSNGSVTYEMIKALSEEEV